MLAIPKDADTRFKITEGIKTPEGKEMVIITEFKKNGETVHELRSKEQLEEEQRISEALAPGPEVRDMVQYPDRFMISAHGDLISKKTNKVLSKTLNDKGYPCHSTRIGGRKGKCVVIRVHRAVAEAFVENPDNKPFVNHDDGIKINSWKDNLIWSTASENSQHAFDTGLSKPLRGFDGTGVKKTPEEVRAIRALAGTKSFRAIGRDFNIDHKTVSAIVNRRSFEDFEPES